MPPTGPRRIRAGSWSIWAAAFVAINLGHSIWLITERHLLRLTAEERRLKDSAFGAIDPVLVRKLLRRGTWRDLASRRTAWCARASIWTACT